MQFRRVYLESLGYTLPKLVVTTAELEAQLAPVYERLHLPAGRLELMTGIRERRFWLAEQPVSDHSITSGRKALQRAPHIRTEQIGALVHGSVCRDHLEPATACRVHAELGLPAGSWTYDLSNACLGILNGAVQVATLIEAGQIEAGLVVGTENGRALVENTVAHLNADESLSRRDIKEWIASLTIGSASAAMLLVNDRLQTSGHRLLAAAVHSDTQQHHLCQSIGHAHVMQTDSEQLMREGVRVGAMTFDKLLAATGWQRSEIDKTVCHQVGIAHQKLLLETLGLDATRDYSTFEHLGNTGAAALPTTLAMAEEAEHLQAGDQVALLGIGSGINCLMLGVAW